MDQPLYTLAKIIQWNWAENKILFTFGSLHIEKDMLRILGKILDQRGWTDALIKANIAT